MRNVKNFVQILLQCLMAYFVKLRNKESYKKRPYGGFFVENKPKSFHSCCFLEIFKNLVQQESEIDNMNPECELCMVFFVNFELRNRGNKPSLTKKATHHKPTPL